MWNFFPLLDCAVFVNANAEKNDMTINLKLDCTIEEKYGCKAPNSGEQTRDSSVEPRKTSSRACRYGTSSSQEKVQSRQCKYMASVRRADTVESAIMELEELANKIRWLKGLLQFGFRWSNAMKPSWKILENWGPLIEGWVFSLCLLICFFFYA